MTITNDELPDHPLQALHDSLEEKFGAAASIGENEDVEAWYIRVQTAGLLYVADHADLRDARAVRELKQAEADGALIDIRAEDPAPAPVTHEEAQKVLSDPTVRAGHARAHEYWKPETPEPTPPTLRGTITT